MSAILDIPPLPQPSLLAVTVISSARSLGAIQTSYTFLTLLTPHPHTFHDFLYSDPRTFREFSTPPPGVRS